ncbi:mechanosensitive ion channel family protein [Phenylobacterium soli]|uniref:mechanosensitive ion channel family protein n=1 Tax=Phenylobacterium soli TaxID=2170551 RepID=UPI003617C105
MPFPNLPGAPAPAHAAPASPTVPLGDQIERLVNGGPQAWAPLLAGLLHALINLAIGAGILVVTLWVARWASRLAREALARLHGRSAPDAVLAGFLASLVRYTVVVIGGIAVLQQIGVQTTSVLAVLGAASLAIGLALQGGLSNVAAGVMILLLRPYRIGDRVKIADVVGRVHGLDLFVTRLHDLQNSVVFIPNSKALGEVVVNYSMLEVRRIDMDFGIDYDDDEDLALALLIEIAKADPRIVADPPPWAKVTALKDSSVTVTLRAWTSPAGYRDTQFDLIKAVKQRFQAAGLSFPYPHQVAVTQREFTPPDQARQEAELSSLSAAAKAEAGVVKGRSRGARSTGSTSEAKGPTG